MRELAIPEIGRSAQTYRPLVLLTSNGVRDMTDALRRRCLHGLLDYPPRSPEPRGAGNDRDRDNRDRDVDVEVAVEAN